MCGGGYGVGRKGMAVFHALWVDYHQFNFVKLIFRRTNQQMGESCVNIVLFLLITEQLPRLSHTITTTTRYDCRLDAFT